MGISNADKVRCAIFMLKDDAALWWEGAVIGLDLATLTWAEFKKTFYEKYFTDEARGWLVRNFMSLRQGDKFDAEYVKQFERGCHFAPLIVIEEKERLRHFTDGMRSNIKHDVYMADVSNYKAVANRAFRSKQRRKEIMRITRGRGNYSSLSGGSLRIRRIRSLSGRIRARIHLDSSRDCRGVCYKCKLPGHIAMNCPNMKNTAGHVYVMQAKEADQDTSLVTVFMCSLGNFLSTWKILVRGNATYELLDSGATHSFISQEFIRWVGIIPEDVVTGYDVTLPSGDIIYTSSVLSGLELELQWNLIRADLVVLSMLGFDLILGMDWLSFNGASIDFWKRTISVNPSSGDSFIFLEAQSSSALHVISYVREEVVTEGLPGISCKCGCSRRTIY
ncbi:uncharacterized protein [Henckelia pumila]|uniref:uncharacterized protein n=1 Tax=Henckelia pumila TaxID=405737 RepID=UPI003C6DE91A